MRGLKAIIVLVLLFPNWSFAGEIYGTVRENKRPVVNEPVTVVCGSEQSAPSELDNYGMYKVIMRTTGACTFQIRGLTYSIRSYPGSARYDFEIVKKGNQQVLRRR